MKNILRTIFVFVVGAVFLVSCEKKETNFDAMFNDWDPNNTTYYLQFVDPVQSIVSAIDYADGSLIDITAKISVALLGNPLSTDLVIPITVDPTSTISSDMYTLSASSITIQAGKSSGFITLTTVTENMPIDVPLTFKVTLGTANDAPTGNQLSYTLKRFKYCYTDLAPLVGTWTGIDNMDLVSKTEIKLEGGKVYIKGLGEGWMVNWWGETVLERAWLEMDVDQVSGEFTIDRQYLLTSDWGGDPYRYELDGSGVINACTNELTVTYTIYYEGDSDPAYSNSTLTEKNKHD